MALRTTPIQIGDSNGSNAMYFLGKRGQEPSVLPEVIRAQRMVKETITRPGETHSGYRVMTVQGSSSNHSDIKLILPLVLPNEVIQLQGYYNARPGNFLITLGDGINYLVLFKDKGLVVENYEYNLRVFHKVTLDLYIQMETSTPFPTPDPLP